MIWIASAKRTPQGRFLGSLAKLSAVDLAVAAGRAALAGIDPERIDQVIVGNVLAAGQGMNIARQIGVKLGLPLRVPAFTVNMMCASGMQAVRLAVESIQAGNSRMILCGGTESMSNAPHLLPRSRTGYKLGDAVIVDSLLRDGLVDAFSGQHMGLTAERLATSHAISRADQDQFAASSQQRWLAAREAGRFTKELVPLEELSDDEHPRGDTTAEKLSALKPTFQKDGSITAGNASGLNDGAAMLVVCDEASGREAGLEPLALIEKTSAVGCEPDLMGLGPVYATRALGIDPAVFDAIEINEAFAAQALACIRDLGLDESKVNADGGAIALGHPIGASGARLLVHLAHQSHARSLATLCVGGGMGCAVALRKP
ncbi:acetyl-CoA C-acyltransferase [Verrucomicrobium sp. BvORR034]|uniref:acetyl-CoA C-acyltransferase n=1 Tax=Verrucomicrobium sp. BvORR034 TaxID=1396418 RepID=UPI000679C3B5|nr:acetyl-CoA C-acyltransferase [Verrucomicrobium sp. BvORR034]